VIPASQAHHPSNVYREEYSWQFAVERRLLRQARQWLEPQRHDLIGSRGLLSEALSNAYAHGNRRDPDLPIQVELVVDTPEYELRVTHSGDGFDVSQVFSRYRSGAHYYNVGGNGLRKFDESVSFRVYFDVTGRTVHLWYAPELVRQTGTANDDRDDFVRVTSRRDD
jgi:anti-sigma regulatory factor (Ser/Thr protein kinase)